MVTLPTLPPAPKFIHTPEKVLDDTKRIIKESRELQDKLAKEVSPETATFDNVVKVLGEEENDMGLEVAILGFYQYVSTNKALRDASSEAEKLLDDFGIESAMREDIYKLVSAVQASHERSPFPISEESARLLDKMNKDYIRNGLALPEAERARFKEIKKELSILGIEFSKRLNEENGGIWFTPEELEGVPEDVVSGLKKGEEGTENAGKLWLTFKYPDLFPTMKYAVNPETRRMVFIGNENKCNENVEIFRKAIKLRDEKARLLGFKSHAEFVLEPKMAKSPEKVMSFLTDLREKLAPGGATERARLVELKKKDVEARGQTSDGKYYLWDHRYYDRLLLEKEYALDEQKIAEYFPLTQTIEGMLKIFETLFGLEFVEVTDASKNVWHEDCKQFCVFNEKVADQEREFVGWLYLDLHPRDGKYGHAANFNLQPGFTDKNGKRQYPATALVCNFSKPTPTKPSLLKHDEVVTLFHELGHGIHDLVAKTHYSRFHGTNVVRDFVEAPSQMLENWCWTASELKNLSSHYETGEKIPDEIIDTIIKTKHVNDALSNLRQLHFAFFDMKVHNLPSHEDAKNIDPTIEYNRLRSEIALLDPPENIGFDFGHGEATFGHLMGGYDAGYYGYLWSQVFSMDMFYTAFKEAPMDKVQGRRYRHGVLEKGGSRDEMETLKGFLGREPNSKAFLEELGLGGN
ncbi:metalloendopeptidase [Rhizina undulata]